MSQLTGRGGGSTWLGQKTKFFDRFNLKASLTFIGKPFSSGGGGGGGEVIILSNVMREVELNESLSSD